jgi:hypothetical protein
MVVTKRTHGDHTMTLQPGDHSFIQLESSVDYGTAKLVSVERVSGDLGPGVCIPRLNLTQGLLKRVRAGLLASEHTDNYLKDHCRPLWP